VAIREDDGAMAPLVRDGRLEPGPRARIQGARQPHFEEGRDEQWGAGKWQRTVRYYYARDYEYWVMDHTIEETDLINRARIDRKGPADGFEC
jgi:hypothetical protein